MKTITDKFGQKGQQISITVVSNEKACLFAQLMLSDVNPVRVLWEILTTTKLETHSQLIIQSAVSQVSVFNPERFELCIGYLTRNKELT